MEKSVWSGYLRFYYFVNSLFNKINVPINDKGKLIKLNINVNNLITYSASSTFDLGNNSITLL